MLIFLVTFITACERPAKTQSTIISSGPFIDVIKVKTSRGMIECIRLGNVRTAGISCDWNHPTRE